MDIRRQLVLHTAMRLRLIATLAAALVCHVAQSSARAGDPPDAARVDFYRRLLPEKPSGVGEPISNRKAWSEVARQAAASAKIKADAEAALTAPMPELTDDLYLDYFRTGNREACQSVMFARRSRLSCLVLAECFADEGRYLPAIEATIRSLCKEKSWLYPAHDTGSRVFNGETSDIDSTTTTERNT